jgi:hypothetical protein
MGDSHDQRQQAPRTAEPREPAAACDATSIVQRAARLGFDPVRVAIALGVDPAEVGAQPATRRGADSPGPQDA